MDSFRTKACLHRFVPESLDGRFPVLNGQPQSMGVSRDDEKIVIDIDGGERRFNGDSPPPTAGSPSVESLRNRIEVVGGLSLATEVDFSDMELSGA